MRAIITLVALSLPALAAPPMLSLHERQFSLTSDGHTIIGLIVASTGPTITLMDAQNRKQTIPRGDLECLKQSNVSLMPEKLLDTLSDQQLRDLFAYIRSDPPAKSP